MNNKKLWRRIRILKWIHRTLGLSSYVTLTTKASSMVKLSIEYKKDRLAAEAYVEAQLAEKLAIEMIKKDLVKITKSMEGDDFVKGMETFRGQITIKL